LNTLTSDELIEVENFIDFLNFPGHHEAFATSVMSMPAFESTWCNPEDAVYDALQ
jgi:hypothetical protein